MVEVKRDEAKKFEDDKNVNRARLNLGNEKRKEKKKSGFLPRPIREVLNSGILSVCPSVRPSVRGVAAIRCVVKG